MKSEKPRTIRLKDYRPPSHLIDHVHLEVSLAPQATRVVSRLKIRPNAKATAGGALVLDGEQMTLGDVLVNGVKVPPAAYSVSATALTLHKPPLQPFELEIETTIDPEDNKALQGIYRSRGIYCSQCEAQGFRRITYFLDRPDVLSTYSVRIEADRAEAPVLLGNGNPGKRGNLPGNRHFSEWHDPFAKPCYLFALVGGDLGYVSSSFKTMSGREVALNIHVEHGKEGRAEWAMDALKRSMAWDEKRFGREYDLDVFNIVAVSDFNMGAMENKGLNIFNDRLILASPETATDSIFEAIESVVAHEYFHNWTGNRITCRDWFQLCLKEGLTVFRDQEFTGDERSRSVQRITDVRQLRAMQFPEDTGPLAHPVRPETYIEINNFYTATVYEKGAELVRMIQTILGEVGFRAGMDLYFERHDGDAATIEDFIKCFEEASGRDLSHFALWYGQAGTPELVCSLDWNRTGKTAKLTIEQVLRATPGQPKKKPLHIPLKVGLVNHNGADMALELGDERPVGDGVLHVTKRKQSFELTNVGSRPVPSLLRGFSAPVNITLDLSDRDLEFLMAHDSDTFNRWQAANTYATRTLKQITAALGEGKRSTRGAGFAKALGQTIADESLEPAYRAELLRLPSQADVAREIGRNVDPEHIYRAHRQLLRQVGTVLGSTLEDIYRRMTPKTEGFSPDADSAGRRALRNAALTLLTARGKPADHTRLANHFFKASNMTDEAFAMFLLAASDVPERATALQRFFDRWKADHLVIDTWFAAQAQSPLPRAFPEIEALTRHPLFALTAPNKVRALVGNFAVGNPLQFNRADGAGYDFVVSQVIALDQFNPQIAARILGAFRGFRVLEPKRRSLARKALQRVAKAQKTSRDVYEIVSKMLEP
ncbi:MAG: aminopeptidase N [Hyphomicrobiaceae bacterium]|nr:aminopeptidase N [Hyphomicrobiaceae bacterium]